MNYADRWVYRILLCLLVWIPLPLASNHTWSAGIFVAIVSVLFFSAVIIWRNYVPEIQSRLTQCRLPLSLFVFFLCISVFQVITLPDSWVAFLSPEAYRVQLVGQMQGNMHLSLDLYQSKLMLGLSTAYFTVFVLVLLLVRDANRLSTLVQVMVWSGLFQAILGILLFSVGARYRLFYSELIHSRTIGTFIYHNNYAAYLEMILSMGIGLMIAKLGERTPSYTGLRNKVISILVFLISPKMRLRLFLVTMVIALVLTRSRMGNSAFFSALLIVGGITVLLARRTAPAAAALILSLIIVDVLVVGTWVGLEKVVSRISNTAMENTTNLLEESVEQRTLPAIHALNMVKDFPLFGTGAGSFYNSFHRYQPPEVTLFFKHAHNDFVEITTDMGVIGAATLALLALSALYLAIRTIHRRRSSLPLGVSFGVAMSIVAIGIHCSVDFPLQIPANALTFVVILALSWVAVMLPSGKKLTTQSGKVPLKSK